MNKVLISLSIPCMLLTTQAPAQEQPVKNVVWTVAAKLQNADGRTSLGFAGAINALNHEVLFVAGGANFPEKMPWEGGKKYYSKEIHLLQRAGDHFTWNKEVTDTLPEPIAYCGNTSTDLGLVYAGGENEKGLSAKVFLLNWNKVQKKVLVKSLPDLPLAVTNIALTHLGNMVYALGGDLQKQSSAAVFSLDLNHPDAQWKTLAPLPIAVGNVLAVAQGGKIYVIGGRTKTPSGISELQHTTFVFHPEKQTWESGAAISDGKNTTNFSAGAGLGVGENFILLIGGDNGKVFHQIETYIAQIAQTENLQEKAKLTLKKNALSIKHQGFYKGMLLYNTKTNQWTKLGELPFPAQVTTTATCWNGDIILSNGEVTPGVRTPNVMLGKIR